MTDTTINSSSSTINAGQAGQLSTVSSSPIARMSNFVNQPAFKRSLPLIVSIVFAGVVLIFFALSQKPSLTSLYDSLSASEKAKMLDALTAAGYDATVDPATGNVLIPTSDFHEAKLSLAAQGLPASTPDGYSELNNLPMGASRSVEAMKLKQAQEVEIARSISAMSDVIGARVHLALPEKSVFVRDRMDPTASVFVQLGQGRSLDELQVEAILNLVSASVAGLSRDDVTVIDQNGRLLSNSPDDPASILSDTQLQYRMRLENIYRSRIESILTPLVGLGNATAQVNIEIDFTRTEITEETVDPKRNALVSEQNALDLTTKKEARGIPGALSNDPPAEVELTTDADEVDPTAQAQNYGDPGGSNNNNLETRSSREVKNYEVSKKIQTTQKPSTQLMKIDAAVLLRQPKVIDPETGLLVSHPYNEQKLEEIRALIKSTVGLQDDRGDTLAISTTDVEPVLSEVAVDWYQMDWVKSAIQNVVIMLMLGVVVLGVIRPLINRLLVPVGGSGTTVAAGIEDDDVDLTSIEVNEGESLEDIKAKLKPKKSNISLEMLDTANTYDDKVAIIRMMVNDEAGRVSTVFKQMMARDLDLI
ncbi:flagellar basal-body M-ring protein/flagellar hook-basal body protein FliF [Rhodobacteraceae bacterium HIMB11]|nr:flagellar basal-body M-ring protein/flagellar hook-basal body protein FliF [Rhodobacteraceae bacterium HIMB11]